MRALAFLIFGRVEEQGGTHILSHETDFIRPSRLNELVPFWLYLQVELDKRQEGIPIHVRVEVEPKDGSATEVALFDADLIGPMGNPDGTVPVFRIYEEVEWAPSVAGVHEVRAYVDGTQLADRLLRVRPRQN